MEDILIKNNEDKEFEEFIDQYKGHVVIDENNLATYVPENKDVLLAIKNEISGNNFLVINLNKVNKEAFSNATRISNETKKAYTKINPIKNTDLSLATYPSNPNNGYDLNTYSDIIDKVGNVLFGGMFRCNSSYEGLPKHGQEVTLPIYYNDENIDELVASENTEDICDGIQIIDEERLNEIINEFQKGGK